MTAHDPFTGARILNPDVNPTDPRLGVPPDKFGMHATPLLTADRRQAVAIMLFPPEELRDQPLAVIEQVIARQSQGILKSIALEIYKSFTSDPLDATGAANIAQALLGHVEGMAKGAKP